MFAVVRTGGKQYRVTAGDKIVVEKLSGNAGDKIDITDILLAGEGSDLKPVAGLTVAAEIVAQAKGEKVTVFKKRRRHNYRRKKGHRQQHTILKIVAIGDHKHVPSKAEGAEKKPAKAEVAQKAQASPKAQAGETPAATAKQRAKATADEHKALETAGKPTENPAPNNEKAAGAAKPAAKKATPAKAKAEAGSTKNAAPAKAAAKKSPKKK
jgi:large subunit ribosomal protein L21